MGMFQGREWKEEDGKRSKRFMLAYGTVTVDPRVETYKATKVSLGLRWYRDSFIHLEAYEKDPPFATLCALKQRDAIVVFGTYTETNYTNKNGEVKKVYMVRPEIVIPQELINYIVKLLGSKTINKVLEKEDGRSDLVEGLEEYTEQKPRTMTQKEFEELFGNEENYDEADEVEF